MDERAKQLLSMQSGMKEFELPEKLGSTISFGFTIEIAYGKLPLFLNEFLRPEQKPEMLVDVAGVQITVPEQNPPNMMVRWQQEKNDRDARLQEEEEKIKPVPVTVLIACRVIDVDQEKLPKGNP